MRSVRDADSNARQWSRSKSSQQQNNFYGGAIEKIQRELSRMRRRINGGSSSGGTSQYKITGIPGGNKDYFLAASWDGTTLGTDDEFTIAKQFVYRPSITSVTILGTAITYVYSDDNHRTSDDGVNPVQSEELYWPFEVDSGSTNGIVIASTLDVPTGVLDADGNDIFILDMTAHIWAMYS